MRIFSYILTALVTIFIINIALSFSLPAYRNTLVQVRTGIFPATEKIPDIPIAEDKKSESARLVESLDRIDKHIESLSEKNTTNTGATVMSGVTLTGTGIQSGNSGTVSSGGILLEEESIPKESDIPLSGIFLSKIMPEVVLKKIENS